MLSSWEADGGEKVWPPSLHLERSQQLGEKVALDQAGGGLEQGGLDRGPGLMQVALDLHLLHFLPKIASNPVRLQFSLQVDECEAKSDEDSYTCTSCCR